MHMHEIPFGLTDWNQVEATEHPGQTGLALWRTRQFGALRVRLVEYSPGYCADHWCSKGHILLCLEGQLETELADGRKFILTPGVSYQVADNTDPHRSSTQTGARLFIVD
jgi:quercetin dioxygenase-like cupin family protein